MEKKNIKSDPDFEPQWLKDAAKSMLKEPKESNGDEDQDDLMELIDNNEDDQL